MNIQDKRNLIVRIMLKMERGLPLHAAMNSVLAGFSQEERDEVKRQFDVEQNHGVSPQ